MEALFRGLKDIQNQWTRVFDLYARHQTRILKIERQQEGSPLHNPSSKLMRVLVFDHLMKMWLVASLREPTTLNAPLYSNTHFDFDHRIRSNCATHIQKNIISCVSSRNASPDSHRRRLRSDFQAPPTYSPLSISARGYNLNSHPFPWPRRLRSSLPHLRTQPITTGRPRHLRPWHVTAAAFFTSGDSSRWERTLSLG